MIVIPEERGLLGVGIVARGALTREGAVLGPAIAHRCRPTAMQMHDGPGRKRRNGLIGRSPTASGLILCAIRGGDGGDRIRLVLRESVDPFDLNALPPRDLRGLSLQRALLPPHL